MKDENSTFFCNETLWKDNNNPIWLASTISLYRNIEKFKFPAKLTSERQKQIITLLSKELMNYEEIKKPTLYKAEELSALQKQYMGEHFLTNENFQQAHSGEAFIIDESSRFLAELNIDDHIRFLVVDTKGELENSWNKLVKIESQVGKTVNYSFSQKFGFLTADPSLSGTALNLTVFIQPSALIHTKKINAVLEKLLDESLIVTGIQGNPTEIIGDVLCIRNNYTLGITEEAIISSLRSITTKLMIEEHAARKDIKNHDNPQIKDKVSRAFGILMHSYQIEAIEALNALSLVKLGVEFGWISGASQQMLNEIFFNCRRAHLLCQFGDEKISQDEIPHKRSEYIHKTLKDVKLVI